jgi:hypothetical protein
MAQATARLTPEPFHVNPAGVEIPQIPRFAVQRLTEAGRWETLTFGTCGDEEPEDSPYHGEPLIYHSAYIAAHIAKAYPGETVRVHEIGGAQ